MFHARPALSVLAAAAFVVTGCEGPAPTGTQVTPAPDGPSFHKHDPGPPGAGRDQQVPIRIEPSPALEAAMADDPGGVDWETFWGGLSLDLEPGYAADVHLVGVLLDGSDRLASFGAGPFRIGGAIFEDPFGAPPPESSLIPNPEEWIPDPTNWVPGEALTRSGRLPPLAGGGLIPDPTDWMPDPDDWVPAPDNWIPNPENWVLGGAFVPAGTRLPAGVMKSAGSLRMVIAADPVAERGDRDRSRTGALMVVFE